MAGHVCVEVRDRRHIGEIEEAAVDGLVSAEVSYFDIAVNASRPTSGWRSVKLVIANTHLSCTQRCSAFSTYVPADIMDLYGHSIRGHSPRWHQGEQARRYQRLSHLLGQFVVIHVGVRRCTLIQEARISPTDSAHCSQVYS